MVGSDYQWIDHPEVSSLCSFTTNNNNSLNQFYRQYVGDPINCTAYALDKNLINSYCWGQTYNFLELHDLQLQTEVVHSGIGISDNKNLTKIYNDMYQLMPYVIAIIGGVYYIPNLIWKALEKNEMDDMTRMVMLKSDTYIGSHNHNVWITQMKFHFSAQNRTRSNLYAIRFFICETLNLLVTIGLVKFTK